MKKQFKELLHRYKMEAFRISHGNEQVEQATNEIIEHTKSMLNNAYHYRFQKNPDAERIETFNMIKNYTLEALLPPVLEKLVRHILVLEKQHEQMLKLVHEILETLSDEDLRLDKATE